MLPGELSPEHTVLAELSLPLHIRQVPHAEAASSTLSETSRDALDSRGGPCASFVPACAGH